MTYDEVLKRYPREKYDYISGKTYYSGFQDSKEETEYEIKDKKTNQVVIQLTHTLVNEGIRTVEDYWS